MRSNAEITEQELQNYTVFCREQGIIFDGEAGSENGTLFRKYFLETWKENLTPENLAAALVQLRPYVKFLEPGQAQFEQLVAKLTPQERQEFSDWRGEVGLVQSYKNGVIILTYLRDHRMIVNKANLQFAIGQNRVHGLLEWDRSAGPQKPADPRQHADDGTSAFKGTKSEANVPLWLKLSREREARDKANAIPTQQTREVTAWEQLAEGMLRSGRSHGQNEALQHEYDKAANGAVTWRQAATAMQQLQKSFTRLVPIAKF